MRAKLDGYRHHTPLTRYRNLFDRENVLSLISAPSERIFKIISSSLRYGFFMEKDFDRWNKRKKRVDAAEAQDRYFHEREVWWAYAGLNVGYEQDGKGSLFLRPVLVVRKFNKHLFAAVPLTTKLKENPYYHACAVSDGMPRMAIVSQVKALSSRRLYTKIGFVSASEHEAIKNAVKAALDGVPRISGADSAATEPEGHL